MTPHAAVAAASSTDAGAYIHWGVINISVTNASIILAMIVLFVLAILIPFPGASSADDESRGGE